MKYLVLLLLLVFTLPPAAPSQTSPENQLSRLRSFDELFPGLVEEQRKEVFSEGGLILAPRTNRSLQLIPAPGSGIDLHSTVLNRGPNYFAESLLVVPYPERTLTTLDAYNALGKIRDLKGRIYHSYSRDAEVPLFEDATRIESIQRNNPIPDPQPATVLPASETVYLCLKDVNFGKSYYRGDISTGAYGITYSLTNIKSLTYLFFTVMKEEKFSTVLYIEPLAEGMLVYSAAGAAASDFMANRISIAGALEKRLAVFIDWLRDGLNRRA